jgi:hypothetical protein
MFNKVSRPDSDIYLNETPTFEWWVVRFRIKNGHQKEMCSKEIGLQAQNVLTILSSIVNTIGGTYVTLWLTFRSFNTS